MEERAKKKGNASSPTHSSLVVLTVPLCLPALTARQTRTHPAPPTSNPHPHTMADDAPVTFNDLPDDMLHEIFGGVFQDPPEGEDKSVDATARPQGTHLALRSVCRAGVVWPTGRGWRMVKSGLRHTCRQNSTLCVCATRLPSKH